MVLRCDRFGRDGFDAMAMANKLVLRGCHFVAVDMRRELTTQFYSSLEHPVNVDAYMASFAEGLKYSADLSRKTNNVNAWCREVRGDSVHREYGWRTTRQDVTIKNQQGDDVLLTGDKGRLVSEPDPQECFVLALVSQLHGRVLGYDRILAVIQERNIRPRRGRQWTVPMLKRLAHITKTIQPDDPRFPLIESNLSDAPSRVARRG
jgi:hypothetical protein